MRHWGSWGHGDDDGIDRAGGDGQFEMVGVFQVERSDDRAIPVGDLQASVVDRAGLIADIAADVGFRARRGGDGAAIVAAAGDQAGEDQGKGSGFHEMKRVRCILHRHVCITTFRTRAGMEGLFVGTV